jgi:hypothetical protein
MAVPVQVPLVQLSFVVQMLPSLQLPVFGTAVQPVPWTHESVVHSFPSLHTLGWPTQFEPEQASFTVQSLLSVQAPVWFVCWQTPFWQVSSVQYLLSSQFVQTPPFRPQFCGESTQQAVPEMHPVQQVPF